MCTVLDAHPKVAMSYELYLNLLENDPPVLISDILSVLSKSKTIIKAAKRITDPKISTFLIRCERGGLSLDDVKEIFIQVEEKYSVIDNDEARGEILSRCCTTKMIQTGSSIWGAKCNNNVVQYHGLFPGSRFIYVVRDGRDILASQMTTGSFKPDSEKLAVSWSKTYQKFKLLSQSAQYSVKIIKYEDLVMDPEHTIEDLCEFLSIEKDRKMLSHDQQDLTIFKANHLSKKQVMKPIDTSRIGRWKQILSDSTVKSFTENAESTLQELNYI